MMRKVFKYILFIILFLLLIKIGVEIYIEYNLPVNWRNRFIERYHKEEDFFVGLTNFYLTCDFTKIVSGADDKDIIEIDGSKYCVRFFENEIMIFSLQDDGLDKIEKGIQKRMGFCKSFNLYLDKETYELYRITVNTSIDIPEKYHRAQYELMWTSRPINEICDDSQSIYSMGNGWYFIVITLI